MKREREEVAEVNTTSESLGGFIFSAFDVLLYKRVALLFANFVVSCVQQVGTEKRLEKVDQLKEDVKKSVLAFQRLKGVSDHDEEEDLFDELLSLFRDGLREIVSVDTDQLSLVKQLLRYLEINGFPELESEQLELFISEVRHCANPRGYSYSVRPSMSLPFLPRFEGDRRPESEFSKERQGVQVILDNPHRHPEVNSIYQLSEPKKRKPLLDEGKIFSHPKKTARCGTEDFLVDEALLHRSLVVLQYHIDTFGSLEGLSPFARFTLWWNVLDRNSDALEQVNQRRPYSEAEMLLLRKVRSSLESQKTSYDALRTAARCAAQQVGWFAVSAQWRDQVLYKLESVLENDWCCLSDCGYRTPSRFPNYAKTTWVLDFASRVLQSFASRTGASSLWPIIESIILPLFRGGRCVLPKTVAQWQSDAPTVSEWIAGRGYTLTGSTSIETYVLHKTVLFPIQCVGELLELCSLVQLSKLDRSDFITGVLQTDLSDEESIVTYLARVEPQNVAIAPLVAVPQLCRDVMASVENLTNDRLVPFFVCLNQSVTLAGKEGSSVYGRWCLVRERCPQLVKTDDLLQFTPQSRDAMSGTLFHVAHVQLCPPVWKEEIQELILEEIKDI